MGIGGYQMIFRSFCFPFEGVFPRIFQCFFPEFTRCHGVKVLPLPFCIVHLLPNNNGNKTFRFNYSKSISKALHSPVHHFGCARSYSSPSVSVTNSTGVTIRIPSNCFFKTQQRKTGHCPVCQIHRHDGVLRLPDQPGPAYQKINRYTGKSTLQKALFPVYRFQA